MYIYICICIYIYIYSIVHSTDKAGNRGLDNEKGKEGKRRRNGDKRDGRYIKEEVGQRERERKSEEEGIERK